jgi:hypothetical protein
MSEIGDLESVVERKRTTFLGRLVVAIVLSLIVLVVTAAAYASARWQAPETAADAVEVPI